VEGSGGAVKIGFGEIFFRIRVALAIALLPLP
jgi:hypothetical protein